MTFKEGDFVKIDYSIRRNSDGTVVRTTERQVAEKNGIYDKESVYTPQLVVLGKDSTIKGIQNALMDMSVGQKKTIELQPAEAFGERDKELVRVMPLSDFRKRDMEPVPGMQIDLDGIIATVVSVNSGRVMVDANHPLAGEKITCEISVISKVDDGASKVKAAFERYGIEPSSAEMIGNAAKVSFGAKIKKDSRFLIDKANAIAFAFNCIDVLNTVKVEEEYSRAENKPQSLEESDSEK
ncbi:MAG: peptidylprolyl isomerase [Candidatus Marsarchaeota archaeon]|jgi:FKBP-type peptidyl-prolyl cis-trans isomerase 2|nr:peptidylprolyl isomerase [Candidatus Marsarchaeota archaeon]